MARRFAIGLLVLVVAVDGDPGQRSSRRMPPRRKDPIGPVEVSAAVYSDVSAPVQ